MRKQQRNGNAQRFELEVPSLTIVKLLIAALAVWALLKLWPELIFLSISVILAIALEPTVRWLGRHRLGRGAAVALITALGLALIAALVWLVVPPMASQLLDLSDHLPQLAKRVQSSLPDDNPVLHTAVTQLFALPGSPEVKAALGKPLNWGQSALSGLMTTAIVLVVTVYLLLDGRRLYAWLLAFVPRRQREKMARTVEGVSKVVHGYVRGQVITSALFTVFTAMVLSALHVPSVLPLAVLAGFCDIIPVMGIIISTAPAALLAMTVSPVAAIAVTGLYLGYHLFETYVLVPRLYGRAMRLSTLTVLLALIIGGALQGILGAVLVLPIVAAYPIVERIWLREYFADEVIADHRALDTNSGKGDPHAVEAVLQGEKHPDESIEH